MEHIVVKMLDGNTLHTTEPILDAHILEDGFLYLYGAEEKFLGAVNSHSVTSFVFVDDAYLKDLLEETAKLLQ